MRPKLIEVAIPLEAINREAAREKSIRHGHPSTLHLWWARRPLAACRAVIFSTLVDDPSAHPDRFPTEDSQVKERERLFGVIERLIPWENSSDESVLKAARRELPKDLPPLLDPFCGGGSIPLEAQRLGLDAHGSDLNPVAVLVSKALVEFPPLYSGRPPVHPDAGARPTSGGSWKRATGLAEDIRLYGAWMRGEAEKSLGRFYPKARVPAQHGGAEATVVVWLWTRTVKCPNPVCGAQMPLARSFWLCTKAGREAWLVPVVDRERKTVRFDVKTGRGKPADPPKKGRGSAFACLVCGQVADDAHVKAEGLAGRMSATMTSVVAATDRGRVYLPATDEHLAAALRAPVVDGPEDELAIDPRNIWCTNYGLRRFRDLFTRRQLAAMTTFSDLVWRTRERVLADAIRAGYPADGKSLEGGGTGANAYADAVATYMGLAVDRAADAWSSVVGWRQGVEATRGTFARQALPMTWDFAEANPFGTESGNWTDAAVEWIAKVVAQVPAAPRASIRQLDAAETMNGMSAPVVCTDPPYYDNISYANLSDFFYVWLRRSLGRVHPQLFATLLTPKAQELVADPYRFDSPREAEEHFENGLRKAFGEIRESANPDYPLTVYYAFKQAEDDDADQSGNEAVLRASTGWERMLEALLASGFAISGTWPLRTERGGRTIAIGANALASSVLLTCWPQSANAPLGTLREFVATLKRDLPHSLRQLQRANIAPVDLAQATVGPGMRIFTSYSRILEADGRPMSVRTALQLINQELDAYFEEQEGDLDPSTRWAIAWFDQYGTADGAYGVAETLSKAKNTSLRSMEDGGLVVSKGGKVRLKPRGEFDGDWDPRDEDELTLWSCVHHVARALEKSGVEGAGAIVAKLGAGRSEEVRALAYRLYALAEKRKWTDEALGYNALVTEWPAIQESAARVVSQSRLGI